MYHYGGLLIHYHIQSHLIINYDILKRYFYHCKYITVESFSTILSSLYPYRIHKIYSQLKCRIGNKNFLNIYTYIFYPL